jgi:hypothetical protein
MMMGMSLVFADGAAQLKAIHLGQHHVQNGDVKAACPQPRQAIAGLEGLGEGQLEPLEIGGQRRAELFVVVNQQNTVHVAFLHCRIDMPVSRG